MKNRFLPSVITAFLSFSLLFFFELGIAGQPGNPDLPKLDGSRWERIRANQNSGVVNPIDVSNALQQAEALRLKTSVEDNSWTNLGPDNFPGLIWSAIFDKTDPSGMTIIAGSANGGIWKSIDLGLTWMPMIVENNIVPKVSSLIQTSDGTIYAATGVTTCKSITYIGNGIYRSGTNGEFHLIVGTSTLVNPDFTAVSKLAINQQSGRLYAATFGGLYSSDNGTDWVKTLPGYSMDVCVGPDGTVLAAVGDSAYLAPGGDFNQKVNLTTGQDDALPQSGIGWMVFAVAPSDAQVMYASLAAADGKLLNIYKSSNRGATWSIVFPSNTTFEPFSGYGCYSNAIAVFPKDPSKLYIGGRNMWYGRMVDSTGFYNWEQVSFGNHGAYSPLLVPLYHHTYCFRPNNDNQFAVASDGGVSIATIGADGVTYQTSNKNLESSQFNSVAFSAQKNYAMGGGFRIGTLVLGYFAPAEVSFPSNGYQVWQTDASALPFVSQPQPSNYCGDGGPCVWSSVDSRVALYTKTGSQKVRRQDFTDINYYNNFAMGVKTDSTGKVPMHLWETFNQGKVLGITRDSVKYYAEFDTIPADTTVMVRSASNGFLFPYVITKPLPKGDSVTVADPIASRLFLYGDSLNNNRGIFMTKDMIKFRGDPVYFQIFKNLVANDPLTALTVSEDLHTLWAGTSKGRLIRIAGILNAYDSATANFNSSQCVLIDTVFANTPFVGRYVTSISINPHNTDRVMVTLGNYGNQDYVYYSKNGNSAAPLFTSVQSDLPKAPVFSGLLEMTDENNAILGTDVGVFTTTNLNSATPQWTSEMQNIGNVPATSVRQQVIRDYHILNYGMVYISTYGRGLWSYSKYLTPVGIDPVQGETKLNGALKLSPNPVNDVLNVSYRNDNSATLTLSVYDLSGRLLMASPLGRQTKGILNTTVNLSSLSQGTYIIKVGNSAGKIVKL
jgi:hypothetical protein